VALRLIFRARSAASHQERCDQHHENAAAQ